MYYFECARLRDSIKAHAKAGKDTSALESELAQLESINYIPNATHVMPVYSSYAPVGFGMATVSGINSMSGAVSLDFLNGFVKEDRTNLEKLTLEVKTLRHDTEELRNEVIELRQAAERRNDPVEQLRERVLKFKLG